MYGKYSVKAQSAGTNDVTISARFPFSASKGSTRDSSTSFLDVIRTLCGPDGDGRLMGSAPSAVRNVAQQARKVYTRMAAV